MSDVNCQRQDNQQAERHLHSVGHALSNPLLPPLGRKKWVTEGMADGVQMALGLLVVLPLAVDVAHWKAMNPSWKLVVVWLLGCLTVIAAVLKLKAQPIRLGLPTFQRLDRRDW